MIYLLDAQGWYYRYSHLHSFADGVQAGAKVKAGQRLGLLGKEGASGGWSHLHLDIFCRQPSGKWGCQEAYAFVWEAYRKQYDPKLIAVARPHHFLAAGETAMLDGGKSWSADGKIVRYQWTFIDGTTAEAPGWSGSTRGPATTARFSKSPTPPVGAITTSPSWWWPSTSIRSTAPRRYTSPITPRLASTPAMR